MKRNKKAVILLVMIIGLTGCGKKEPKIVIDHKIVGKWSGKTFDGAKSVLWDFSRSGNVKMSQDGKEITNEKYRLIDDKTVELETKSGTKYTLKVEFSNNDNAMTVTDFTGIKTPLKRE